MLSVSAVGANLNYYLELATAEYYLKGGEPPGKWIGAGSKALGLSGQINPDEFQKLAAGFSADGKQKLVQNAGKEKRQVGWDLTFSAPKSVSVFWAVAPESVRKAIQECHEKAVQVSLGYIEEVASFSRTGKGGKSLSSADLVVGLFEHGTSRAADPQLHSHAIVLNLGVDQHGKTRTILSEPIYRQKMTAGALYRLELAHQLISRLGVRLVKSGFSFAVKGIPQSVCEHFSKRRTEIEKALNTVGHSSARASQIATLETRRTKDVAPRSELFATWQDECRKLGLNPEHVSFLLDRKPGRKKPGQHSAEAFRHEASKHSYFSKGEVLREAAVRSQPEGVSVSRLRSVLDEFLGRSPEVVALDAGHFTSRKNQELEDELLAAVSEMEKDSQHKVDIKTVEKHLLKKKNSTLSDEQSAALSHITMAPGSVQIVSGKAGTGKTELLRVAADVWKASGLKVYGACVAGKAARGLEEATGIQSETVAKVLYDSNRSLKTAALHQARQLWRAAQKKPTYRYKRSFKLNSRSVLVLDEAAMIGTQDLHALISEVKQAGAKIVLVGDSWQLQPITPGNPFRSLSERIGAVQIDGIRRQTDAFDRQVVTDLSEGRSEDALRSLEERGRVHLADDRRQAMQQLVEDWGKNGQRNDPIFVPTRKEAEAINRHCQKFRKRKRELGLWNHFSVGKQRFHKGDRIIFEQRDRRLGVENGDYATIEKVNTRRGVFTAVLDSGKKVLVPLRRYREFSLGYATTVHKGQGATVEKAFVLLGGSMQNRFLSYVQLSRARGETHVYVDRFEAGRDGSGLASRMKQGRVRALARDVTEEVARQEPRHERPSQSP